MRRLFSWLRNRQFLAAFSFTLIGIFLTAGMITVDYRGRAMTFDDTAPVAALVEEDGRTDLRFHLFGEEQEFDVTWISRLLEGIADFVCFPHD